MNKVAYGSGFVRRLLSEALLRAKTVALRPNSDDDIQHKRALISLNKCYMDVDDSQVANAYTYSSSYPYLPFRDCHL